MKLRRRPKRKVEKALDALTGATRIWSDLQVGKRAGKGVRKAKRLRLPGALRSVPAKAIGAATVAGGVGAIVARKLKGDGPREYTGPPPSAAAEAAASAPDAPQPPTVTPVPRTEIPPPGAVADPATDGEAATGDQADGEQDPAGGDAAQKP